MPDHVKEPVPGNNLTLTIDVDLQKVVEKELDAALERTREAGYEGRGGAVVAMNPENGEVMALASRPDFDPQLFVGGISGAEELEQYKYLIVGEVGRPVHQPRHRGRAAGRLDVQDLHRPRRHGRRRYRRVHDSQRQRPS